MMRRQRDTELENAGGCEYQPDLSSAQFQSERASTILRPSAQQPLNLARIIEGQVIPRLLLANRRGAFKAPVVAREPEPDIADRVGEFADLVINRDMATSKSYFEAMLADGSSVEMLFRDLLAPTARRLGELWEEDINSMLDVTQGMAHMQQLIRTFAPRFHEDARHSNGHHRALIMPLPGEQHTMGCSLVEEYFRRDNWHVWGEPPSTIEEVVALVGDFYFEMVGFSVSSVPEPEKLALTVRIVREAARNRNMAIMVGGWAFVREPALAALIGADATAIDGPGAVAQITGLIGTPRLQQ